MGILVYNVASGEWTKSKPSFRGLGDSCWSRTAVEVDLIQDLMVGASH